MTKNVGWYWHVHHDYLLEWCWSAQIRQAFISDEKPVNEVETRLKWMTPVKGQLPDAFIEAWDAHRQAEQRYRDLMYDCIVTSSDQATLAKQRLVEKWRAYKQARDDHKTEIEALHAKEHPGCPWDGETLVFPTMDGTDINF